MSTVLEARHVRRRYDGRTALAVDGLAVERGETLCVMGPNGAGKSTLVRILNLVERPDAGVLFFKGNQVEAGDVAARRAMAGVFQRPHLFRGSVAENVAFGLKLRRSGRGEIARRTAESLELLGISHLADHDGRSLSGGEAQKVALARAIAVRPEVLFLDEPAGHLDPHARRDFHADLRRIAEGDDTTVVYVTHSLKEAIASGDRIVLMRDGGITQLDAAERIFRHPADGFTARLLGFENLLPGRVDAIVGGGAVVELDAGGRIYSTCREDGRVLACIRSEEITLHHPAPPGELARTANRLPALVASVRLEGALFEVVLDCGHELVARVTRPTVIELGLEPGQEVEARFDESSVHLVRDDPVIDGNSFGKCSRGVLLERAFAEEEVEARD